MDETLSPSSLKDFEVMKQVGKGSYGTVFKVRKRLGNQIYAMKTINISQMDKKTLGNTLNELRILCSINHPNIVGYKEAFLEKDGKELCVIMEFVGGGDMEAKISECKKKKLAINEETIWKYTCQILMGLKALHDLKIIHRDIKSANLFLTEDFETIKLGDLNVAKIAKNDLASTQIGTPYYLAPEIWQNKLYDYRCDIFSLGCVMYEMASLRVPFEANSLQDLFKKITKGVIERIPPRYSDDLYNCTKLFLTKDPKNRPNVKEILSMPLFGKKMEIYNGFDVEKDKREVDRLMDTIIVPRNIGQLKNKLPKKLERAQSCKNMKKEDSEASNQSRLDNEKLLAKLRFNKENSEKRAMPEPSKVQAKVEDKKMPSSGQKTSKLPPVKTISKLPPMKPPMGGKNVPPQDVASRKDRPVMAPGSRQNLDPVKPSEEQNNGPREAPLNGRNRPRVSSADPFSKQNNAYEVNYRPVWWGNN